MVAPPTVTDPSVVESGAGAAGGAGVGLGLAFGTSSSAARAEKEIAPANRAAASMENRAIGSNLFQRKISHQYRALFPMLILDLISLRGESVLQPLQLRAFI